MASPEISVPDKVTITLRDPERSLLTYKRSRELIDLFHIAGPIPTSHLISARRHAHSLVYLAQDFGVIDTDYDFNITIATREMYSVDTRELYSASLNWDLCMTSLKNMIDEFPSDERPLFQLTLKAEELLEAVGGPRTIDNKDTVTVLGKLARTAGLFDFARYIFLKKEGKKFQGDADKFLSYYPVLLRRDLENLEQELRSS